MPWKVYEEDGRFCVHKLNADDSQGEQVACHDSRDAAEAQMRALYANEGDTYSSVEARSREAHIPFDRPEARSVAFTDLDVTNGGRTFDGYAGVYGQEADLGAFIETMVPPAFRSGLATNPNLPMLWHHNETLPPFATAAAGTLQVSEDRRGLRVKADIDERHLLGPTLISMMERGEVRGMSIGFITGRENNKLSRRDGRMVRTITGFKRLLDVSPTWEPAYEGTSAELRSLTEAFQQVPVLTPEQGDDGEPQSDVAGQGQEDIGAQDPASEPEEQRSGADAIEIAAAARRRRLQLLGISLPS